MWTPQPTFFENYTVNDIVEVPKSGNLPQILHGPTNVTAFLGDRVEMRCQVPTNVRPLPTVQWFSKREGKLPTVGPNFRIHKNNSLIFRRVDKRDESYYHCVAKNRQGTVESNPARLTVEGMETLLEQFHLLLF